MGTVQDGELGLVAAKASLRAQIKARLKAANPSDMAEQSRAICERILLQPSFLSAQRVICYLSCHRLREVDTSQLVTNVLDRQVALFVPIVKDQSSNMAMVRLKGLEGLQKVPPFGILEPEERDSTGALREDIVQDCIIPDVVILPGLAFDQKGRRLGRGGGYYDKFLAQLEELVEQEKPRPVLMGVCFREQVVDRVPMGAHDCRCDVVVTPDEVHTSV
jgi:5-formyltetrahydrofolate cyclo-ligase